MVCLLWEQTGGILTDSLTLSKSKTVTDSIYIASLAQDAAKIFHHFNEQHFFLFSFLFCFEGVAQSVLALDLIKTVVLLKNKTGSEQLPVAKNTGKAC